MNRVSFHEDLSRQDHPKGGTDRAFGCVFGTACCFIGMAALWFGYRSGWWVAGIGATVLVAAFVRPSVLHPLNYAWLKIGLLLFAIVNPVALAILYYLCVVPTGLLVRALGKDLLNLKRDPGTPTYWISRDESAPARESMRNQF